MSCTHVKPLSRRTKAQAPMRLLMPTVLIDPMNTSSSVTEMLAFRQGHKGLLA